MADVITTKETDLRDESFEWMVGSSIAEIVFQEPHSWWFRLSRGGQCVVHDSAWRLSTMRGILACSEDHRHPFGLPEPFDAREEASAALGGARVVSAVVGEFAPDLVLRFEGGFVLEFLTTSFGYEGWQVDDPSGRHVVVSGSRSASTWQD